MLWLIYFLILSDVFFQFISNSSLKLKSLFSLECRMLRETAATLIELLDTNFQHVTIVYFPFSK